VNQLRLIRPNHAPRALCIPRRGEARKFALRFKSAARADLATIRLEKDAFRDEPRVRMQRDLVFMASCQLMQAAFVRLPYIGIHNLFFPALAVLIVAGILCDVVVEGRVNLIGGRRRPRRS
jgi:hypothetical protein